MDRLGVTEARRRFCQLLGGRARVLVESKGKAVAGIVKPEELELLEAMDEAGTLDEALNQIRHR